MNKTILAVMIIAVVFASGLASAAPSNVKKQITALKEEQKAIDDESSLLTSDIDGFNVIDKQIIEEKASLDAEIAQLNKEIASNENERSSIEHDISQYKGKCAGKTFYSDRGERPSYDLCMSMKGLIESRSVAYNSVRSSLETRLNNYKAKASTYNEKDKSHKAELDKIERRLKDLKEREGQWAMKYKLLVDSKAFRQLLVLEKVSREKCVPMSSPEAAKACLDAIWNDKR